MQIRMKENKNDILCRIIVYELQQEKKTGNLHGNSPKEEYQDYTQRYLNDAGSWNDITTEISGAHAAFGAGGPGREKPVFCEISRHAEQDERGDL